MSFLSMCARLSRFDHFAIDAHCMLTCIFRVEIITPNGMCFPVPRVLFDPLRIQYGLDARLPCEKTFLR